MQDLVLRICFVLGNLTAKQDSARSHLFAQPKALETLLDIFFLYSEKDLQVPGIIVSHYLINRSQILRDWLLLEKIRHK